MRGPIELALSKLAKRRLYSSHTKLRPFPPQ